MKLEQINFMFLTKKCTVGEMTSKGYMTYEYKPWKDSNLAVEIIIEEKEYRLRFSEEVGKGVKFYMGDDKKCELESYLSREIHKYL